MALTLTLTLTLALALSVPLALRVSATDVTAPRPGSLSGALVCCDVQRRRRRWKSAPLVSPPAVIPAAVTLVSTNALRLGLTAAACERTRAGVACGSLLGRCLLVRAMCIWQRTLSGTERHEARTSVVTAASPVVAAPLVASPVTPLVLEPHGRRLCSHQRCFAAANTMEW